MPAAAADAPTGSHHVLARKKYVLISVISQMTTRRTRPMYPDLPVECSAVAIDPADNLPNLDSPGPKTGRVYHRSLQEQAGSCMYLILRKMVRQESGENCIEEKFRLVLTNFFYLSNIRPVSWGVQLNVWVLTMYSRQATPIRRANDASTGRAFVVCSDG